MMSCTHKRVILILVGVVVVLLALEKTQNFTVGCLVSTCWSTNFAIKPYVNDTAIAGGRSSQALSSLPSTLNVLHNLSLDHTIRNNTQDRISLVYSMEAVSRLDPIKAKLLRGDPVTVVINGGSSSAGAPDISDNDRFFVQMVQRLKQEYPKANITIVDRAHGARNTLHSAHLMQSFFPPNMDIVLWEFSINDGNGKGERTVDVRNQLIQWLRNLEAYQEEPPIVIMVYLWKTPFQQKEDGSVACPVYDQHNLLAAEYNFVLGHVNMGAYFDRLEWDFDVLKTTVLADRHHPNVFSHHVLGKFLFELMKYAPLFSPYRKGPVVNKTDLQWACGGNSDKHEAIKQLFSVTGGVVQGSYTADLPHNEVDQIGGDFKKNSSGVLLLNQNLTLKQFGKALPVRHDRQIGIALPCCKNGVNTSAISFDMGQDLYVRALLLTFRVQPPRNTDVRLMAQNFVHQMPASFKIPADLIRPTKWKCLLGGYSMADFPKLGADFVMVKSKVRTLGLCDSNCKSQNDPLFLVSLSVF